MEEKRRKEKALVPNNNIENMEKELESTSEWESEIVKNDPDLEMKKCSKKSK